MREAYSDVSILLVDHDEVDRQAVVEGLRRQRIANPFMVAADGREALAIVRNTGDVRPRGRWVVLLNVDVPGMTGLEFLEAVMRDESLHDMGIFILTNSGEEWDRTAPYRRHVAGYIAKSRVGEELNKVASLLGGFWKLVTVA